MPVVHPARPDDPRLADYRGVSDPRLARASGLFVAEGRFVVDRLIRQSAFRVHSVLVSPAAEAALSAALAALPEETPVYVAPAESFGAITGVHVHRGCLALGIRPAAAEPAALIAGTELAVVLEGVANADNVGGVFRNAAAFGAGAVLLSPDACDPLYRKAIRTSMAATLLVPHARLAPWPGQLDLLARAGFELVALTTAAGAVSLDAYAARPRPGRLALLLGAEGPGLSDAVVARADARVRIPTTPLVDSLNLAVAAGIALARLSRVAD